MNSPNLDALSNTIRPDSTPYRDEIRHDLAPSFSRQSISDDILETLDSFC